jgi:TolB-like protein
MQQTHGHAEAAGAEARACRGTGRLGRALAFTVPPCLRAAAPAVLLCFCAAVPAASQCPDGTPPPCAREVHVAAPPSNSVAVLYFDNLSRDTADAFLADGLTEEIIIRLGQVPRLDVKSRFEVERFRGRAAAQDPSGLGRALRATYLVTGSVQRAGERVRCRYEVVRAATRTQIAGDVVDRASSDLLSVESEIAREVATAITGRLLPEEQARLNRPLTSDPVAYEEYLRGLQAMNSSYDEAALRSALSHLGRAIARDSSFAAAFARKALAWVELADGYVSPLEGYAQGRTAAARALALDSLQALADAVLGAAAITLDLDARQADRLARRALELNPHLDQAHSLLSGALFAARRVDEGLEEAQLAWQEDSLFSNNGVWYAEALVLAHRLDSAAALLPRLRAILPPADADAAEGMVLAARGDLRGAAPLLNWRYYGGLVAGTVVRALLARGDTLAAKATVDSMVAARSAGYYNPIALAKAYAALGDRDRGMEWLRRAFEERTFWLTYVRVDDELASLRADPRYAALDRQLRF